MKSEPDPAKYGVYVDIFSIWPSMEKDAVCVQMV